MGVDGECEGTAAATAIGAAAAAAAHKTSPIPPSHTPTCRYHALRQRRLRAAVARFTHSALAKAWGAWRAHVARRQTMASKLQAAAVLWAGNATADAFYRWRAMTAGERRRRASNDAAATLRRLQLQRWGLRALWLNRARHQQERAATFQAVGHMQGFRWAQRLGARCSEWACCNRPVRRG